MHIIKYSKDITLPKADYIFEKLSDFKKIAPYIRRKIEGEWLIILLKFTYKEVEEVIAMNIPEFANLEIYVSEDIRDNLALKYSEFIVKDKSKYELYLDFLDKLSIDIDDKAARELYSRNKGNIKEIKTCIDKIKESFNDIQFITVKEVNKVIEKDDTVYAKEVIYAYLLDKNPDIPSKGSRLSRYKYMNPRELRDKLLENIDERIAFYACRKVLKYLYDEKVNYLNAKECKELEICKVLDYYTIAHAWLTFRISKPSQFEICLLEIERRKQNASIFGRTILGIDT